MGSRGGKDDRRVAKIRCMVGERGVPPPTPPKSSLEYC